MGNIRQLDETLSNMIAAGEVVENMASVIKELCENAIDAQAKQIDIQLKEAGLKEIRVFDDGDGMDEDDLNLAFKRHATSKIKTHHDLHHIASLGFRGEALPSIGSVAHVEIESSPTDEPGHKRIIRNNQVIESSAGQAKKGTHILVKHLFYNTPARLKHLKSEQKELSLIVEHVNKLALSHPNIAFKLTNNKKVLLKTAGDGHVLKILHQIYPIDIIKNLLPFEAKNQYFSIHGYIAKPYYNRSSKHHMMLFVNRRLFRNDRLTNAVMRAIKTYLPVHKYPILYLNITVDPLLIDVNIHPQKLDVKFSESQALERLITDTLNNTISTVEHISEMPFSKEKREQKTMDFSSLDEQTPQEEKDTATQSPASKANTTQGNSKPSTEPPKRTLPHLDYIGQLHGTYLLFQNEKGMYVMDQHAAAERIRYETYLNKMSQESTHQTTLLTPLEIKLSNHEMTAYKTIKPTLETMGLDTEVSNQTTLNIKGVPSWFRKNLEQAYAETMIKTLLEEDALNIEDIVDQLAKDLSCKHSIRGNTYINKHEVTKLIKDLNACQNPYTCPHGRPTIKHMSLYELENMFERIQS